MYIRKPCGASNNNDQFTSLSVRTRSSSVIIYPVLEIFVSSVHNLLSGYCVCSLSLLSSSLLVVRVFFVLESIYSSHQQCDCVTSRSSRNQLIKSFSQQCQNTPICPSMYVNRPHIYTNLPIYEQQVKLDHFSWTSQPVVDCCKNSKSNSQWSAVLLGFLAPDSSTVYWHQFTHYHQFLQLQGNSMCIVQIFLKLFLNGV